MTRLDRSFFDRPVHDVARDVLGCTLLVDGVGGRIVEVEAYRQIEPASHAYGGQTARNRTMFGPAGRVYVYRSYGIHWCMNLVCESEGQADALLVRALEPTHGLELMAARRGLSKPRLLCSGPGRVCQALGVTREHDGLALDEPPFMLVAAADPAVVVEGPRIGLTKATELPWRYGVAGSPFVSRPFNARRRA